MYGDTRSASYGNKNPNQGRGWDMKKTTILGMVTALTFGLALFWNTNYVAIAAGDLDKNIKVTICHIPPGNPENKHSITISLRALDHHLAHGDYIGECVADTGDDDTTEPTDTDGDGVPDSEDNCPNVYNPGQELVPGTTVPAACISTP